MTQLASNSTSAAPGTTVTPIPNVTLAFDIVNLLGNPLKRGRVFNDAGDEFARQVIYLERVYALGLRFRF